MPVDVMVDIAMPEGAEAADAYKVRGVLDRDFEVAATPGSRWVSGGVGGGFTSERVFADTTYESVSTRAAMLAVAAVAASLLKQGFVVKPHGDALVVAEPPNAEWEGPDPGTALISVVAPVGTS